MDIKAAVHGPINLAINDHFMISVAVIQLANNFAAIFLSRQISNEFGI